jgi:DNA replication and repair protein RecF
MRLTSMALTRFRNFGTEEAEFSPGLNLIAGPNGQGKTNLLEAIHYGCLAHSQRTRKDRELIQWGSSAFVLRLKGMVGEHPHVQSVEYAESGHKRVKVDGRESKRLSDLLGHFSLVSFSPEDLDLVRGGPQLRRRYLDVLLCQFSPEYLDALRHYNGALRQRNSLLKQRDGAFGADVLEAFDAPLIEHGARITRLRRRTLAELAPLAGEAYRFIADAVEDLSLSLTGSVSGSGDEDELREDFRRRLAGLRTAEREAGLTLAGPHREDLAVDLAGRSARDFGSQGQKRSAALSLKLASARLLEAKGGQPPILLLDDVFAELDETRRRRIGELVQGRGQAFVADPRAADLPFAPDRILHIRKGTVREDGTEIQE